MLLRKLLSNRVNAFVFAVGAVAVLVWIAPIQGFSDQEPSNPNNVAGNPALSPDNWKLTKQEISTKYKSNNIPNPTSVELMKQKELEKKQQKMIFIEEQKEYQLQGAPQESPQPVLGENIAPKGSSINASSNTSSSIGQSSVGSSSKFVIKADCTVTSTVKFSLHSRYVKAECLLLNAKFRGQGIVYGTLKLIPDPANYMAVAKLTSIEDVPVTTIKSINKKTFSRNVADVNKRVLYNILLAAGSQTGQQIAQIIAQDAMEAGTSTEYYSSSGNGSTSYSSTSYPSLSEQLNQIPKAALYLGISNLVQQTSNQILGNIGSLPPVFTVREGTEIRVEFYPGGEKQVPTTNVSYTQSQNVSSEPSQPAQVPQEQYIPQQQQYGPVMRYYGRPPAYMPYGPYPPPPNSYYGAGGYYGAP